ncbi:unnamed protein product, partial [Timema podura]|nr:unnamed protein product [Timema podura]
MRRKIVSLPPHPHIPYPCPSNRGEIMSLGQARGKVQCTEGFQGHPRFFNQLSCGLDLVSMAGEWLTATANTNMFTYEIAPVFILMEHVVMEKMREVIGFKGGDSILAPGGSVSNLYAFLAARHKMFPYYKEKGLSSIPGQLVMYTSDQ